MSPRSKTRTLRTSSAGYAEQYDDDDDDESVINLDDLEAIEVSPQKVSRADFAGLSVGGS